jgi:hypothetical protein
MFESNHAERLQRVEKLLEDLQREAAALRAATERISLIALEGATPEPESGTKPNSSPASDDSSESLPSPAGVSEVLQ